MLQTAAHEFGHSLGLSHTDDKQALMAPFYRGFEQSPKLEKDDIRAIQVDIYIRICISMHFMIDIFGGKPKIRKIICLK